MKQKFLTKAIRQSLLLGAVTTGLYGPQVLAQTSDSEDVEEQGKITVTGSRIKRSDVEGALPVTVITREEIELSGESNAADFLRNLTFNSAGSFRTPIGQFSTSRIGLEFKGHRFGPHIGAGGWSPIGQSARHRFQPRPEHHSHGCH